MHVHKITIDNFRSFRDSTDIELAPGMNLVIGENNSGKSSILEAFALSELQYQPHLSLATKPHPEDVVERAVNIELEFRIRLDEIWRYLGEIAYLPMPASDMPIGRNFSAYLSHVGEVTVGVRAFYSKPQSSCNFFAVYDGRRILVPTSGNNVQTYTLSRQQGSAPGRIGDQPINVFNAQIAALLSRLYRFRAERLGISRSPFGSSTALRHDASNLAECLHVMQSNNPDLWADYQHYVRQIFPSFYRVQVVPIDQPSYHVEIRTYLVSTTHRRPDLAIPLSQAGTGIGQVLAILYVAMNSPTPIAIAVDEPNSFLHPKAVRALLAILNALPTKHQYLITTHSPEVIRAANAATVTVISNEQGESKVQTLDPDNLDHIKVGLASIGARLSDVYGADRILWVEGETEELTFPKIATEVAKLDVVGIVMLKVNATGDFETSRGVRPRMVFETYRNLSEAGALLPPAVGFIFDREGRTASEMEKLTKESRNTVKFLGRTCFENYILHPGAIAAVLSSSSGHQVSHSDVAGWFDANGNRKDLVRSRGQSAAGERLYECDDWLTRVHAPNLLSALFSEIIPECPQDYRKTTHSVAIVDWLIRNEPAFLQPLASILKEIIAENSEEDHAARVA